MCGSCIRASGSLSAQVGNELKCGRDIVQLIMRLKMYNAAEAAGPPWQLVDADPAGNQREARPAVATGRQIAVDILRQPILQEMLDLAGGLERADHVPALHLQMMGKPRGAEDRVDLRGQSRIGVPSVRRRSLMALRR